MQNFAVSSDGFGAGEGQSLERPFGHADPGELVVVGRRHRELGRTAPIPAAAAGSTTTSPATSPHNIGAEIMGRNKFGPQRGPWEDDEWKGWWGDAPPFHTPVFVLTHHERPSFTLADTTFHFIDATPAEALQQGAGGGGRQGRATRWRGRRPSASSSTPISSTRCTSRSRPSSSVAASACGSSHTELLDRFHLDVVPSPSGVTHLLFWRR